MRKARIIISLLIVSFFSALGYLGYREYLAPQPPPATPGLTPSVGEREPAIVSAEGRVVPVQFVRLSFGAGGLVEAVYASEGEAASAGELLARLEGSEKLAAAVTAAQLERLSAQQAQAELYSSAELQAAQALQRAATARDALRDAERRLNNLNSPSEQADIDQARANEVLAAEVLEKAREAFEPYADKPETNLTRAALQSALSQAQKEYDAAARLLNNLLAEANEIDLAQAEADLALAQADLADAQSEYEQWKDGPDPDEVALAEARLANAEAQLAAAQDVLGDLELRAPFAGTLVMSALKEGEFVAPGVPLLTLADLSAWQVETIDLAESDVALLAPGVEAVITLDAFAGREFTGKVVEIDQVGEDRRGDVTYTVTLDFDPGDALVRWGMTAFVDIHLR